MHISALDHIVLNVADVERSLQFYQGTLGLSAERVEEWRRGTLPFPSLRINDATLIDLVASSSRAVDGTTNLNLNHFCLVTDDLDLTAIGETLASAGVAIESGPVIRSGARGDALSIYVRDPDHNQIEVRTYARRPLVRTALEQARSSVAAAIDAMQTPDAPLAGNEAWSQRDLIAHLTSIQGWFRSQFDSAGTPPLESVQDFNDRAVPQRRTWSLQQLRDELEQETAALLALLEKLDEPALERVVQQPGRPPRKVSERWMLLYSHARGHLAELNTAAGDVPH